MPDMKHWKTKSSKYLIKDRWLRLRADSCETADGVIVEPYYVQEPDDWVHVVCFNDSFEILMIRQYRHAAACVSLEVPGGVVDSGEKALDAAKRELLEETGYQAGSYLKLQSVCPNPATHTNRVHTFVAKELAKIAAPCLDSSENIETSFMPWKAVLHKIESGDLFAGLHANSIFLSLRHLDLI